MWRTLTGTGHERRDVRGTTAAGRCNHHSRGQPEGATPDSAAGAAVAVLCLLCVGGTTAALLGGLIGDRQPRPYALGCGNGQRVDPTGPMPAVSGLTEDQVRNAAVIIQVGQDLKVAPRGWVIAIATALQESRLTNLPYLGARNDHDSIGLFQQRPSQGWGTPEQLADPAYQAASSSARCSRWPTGKSLPLTVVAQRVQISAYPSAYAKHEPLASQNHRRTNRRRQPSRRRRPRFDVRSTGRHHGVGLDDSG